VGNDRNGRVQARRRGDDGSRGWGRVVLLVVVRIRTFRERREGKGSKGSVARKRKHDYKYEIEVNLWFGVIL
jgi:hypothetical protein